MNIENILQQNHIPYICQYTPDEFKDLKYKYDFYVNNTYIIEFDGPQHQGQISGYFTQDKVIDLIKRDIVKNNYCLQNNIPLYRIPYEYRNCSTLELLTQEQFRVKTPNHYNINLDALKDITAE